MTVQLTWFYYHQLNLLSSMPLDQLQDYHSHKIKQTYPVIPHTQTISNNPIIPSNNIGNTPTTNIAQPNDQSTIILQQFSTIAKELKDFTNKVSSDITKIIQAYNTSHKKPGKLIENATSQALTKAQSITTPATLIDTRNFGTNYTTPHETHWT